MMGQQYLPALEGEQRRADLSQWYTSPWLAERMAGWLLRHHPDVRRILDPAAGRGALLLPFSRRTTSTGQPFDLEAWDLDPGNVEVLRRLSGVWASLVDFRDRRGRHFDAVVENPPFEDGLDIEAVLAGLDVAPIVVALLRGVVRHGLDRWERLWSHVDIVREAVLIERPTFGGAFTPKQDFVVMELRTHEGSRRRGEPMPPHPVEWW